MKKHLILIFLVMLAVGCGRIPKEKAILAKINNYEITQEEFEEEFKESSFGRMDTLESRKEFLNNLINRKLILQDAQRRNLDKDKNFLKMIEKFWEQSLLKIALDRKTKEIAGSAFVSDKTIEEIYNKMFKDGKTDKTYGQMYNNIKWEITRIKESQIMNAWIDELRKNTNIRINYGLLEKNK